MSAGICALCKLPKALQNSHILPNFFYKPLYIKQRLHLYSLKPGIRDKKYPTGIYEKLLCADCERKFSGYESYTASLLNGPNFPAFPSRNRFEIVTNYHYYKLKFCVLSILWRADRSSHPLFADVNLGVRHEQELRKILLAESYVPPGQYPCVMSALVHDGQQVKDLITQVEALRYDGQRGYRLLFGGFMWFIVVSSNAHQAKFASEFMKPGHLLIGQHEYGNVNWLVSTAQKLVASGKLNS